MGNKMSTDIVERPECLVDQYLCAQPMEPLHDIAPVEAHGDVATFADGGAECEASTPPGGAALVFGASGAW